MNIFILDEDIEKNVQYHCDKHVVKMILESAQMLCTVCSDYMEVPYRPVHKNHPCTKWVRESLSNWRWLRDFTFALNEEYKYRYGKNFDHKSATVVQSLREPPIADVGLTPFAICTTDAFRKLPVVEAYREYYKADKAYMCTWKKRPVPEWFNA